MKYLRHTLVLCLLSGHFLSAEETALPDSAPAAPSETDFAALRKTSPFTRVLSLPETYALRGVAMFDNKRVATLYNRETKKTIMVTPEGDNEAGISLVDVVPSGDLGGVSARISFAGDEAELKYELEKIYPQPKIPGGSGDGRHEGGKEGEHRGPSPQDIERFKALPEEKQAKLRDYIGHVMRSYPDMGREERGNLIRGAMVRLIDGREIEVPAAPPQQGKPKSTSGGGDRGGDRGGERSGGDRR